MLRNYQFRYSNITRGSGSSLMLVYIALISISSLAFATVTLKGGDSGAVDDTSMDQDQAATKDLGNQVRLTTYNGAIKRKLKNEGVQSGNNRNTLWNSLANVWLTGEQVHLLNVAFEVGMKDGGLQHAKLLQGVLLQETIAGFMGRIGHLTAPVGKRSYGVMQVKVTAATDVLQRHTTLPQFKSDEELIAGLIVDDIYNIRVASKHLLHLRSRTKTDEHALLAYNLGLRASRRYKDHTNFRYVKKIKRYTKELVAPFNEKFNYNMISQNQSAVKAVASL